MPRLVHLFFVSLLLAAGPAYADGAYDKLSGGAKKIVDSVKTNTPDLKALCSSGGLLQAITQATGQLAGAQKLSGDFMALGQEAGAYFTQHCTALQQPKSG